MALKDFLKENKQLQDEQERLKRERGEKEAQEAKQFREKSKQLFNQVIKPTIDEIAQLLRENQVQVRHGQEVKRITYANNAGVVSILIGYKKSVIQLDIVANTFNRLIDFHFNFNPKSERAITHSLTIPEVTKEKIDELIEEQLKRA